MLNAIASCMQSTDGEILLAFSAKKSYNPVL